MPKILELPRPRMDFPSGRTVELEPGAEDRLVVRGPRGGVEVAIVFTEQGPVLQLSAIAVNLSADTDVSVDCDNFRVRAQGNVELEAGGDSVHRAAGLAYTEADDVAAVARAGDVELQAERDAIVRGDRVRPQLLRARWSRRFIPEVYCAGGPTAEPASSVSRSGTPRRSSPPSIWAGSAFSTRGPERSSPGGNACARPRGSCASVCATRSWCLRRTTAGLDVWEWRADELLATLPVQAPVVALATCDAPVVAALIDGSVRVFDVAKEELRVIDVDPRTAAVDLSPCGQDVLVAA